MVPLVPSAADGRHQSVAVEQQVLNGIPTMFDAILVLYCFGGPIKIQRTKVGTSQGANLAEPYRLMGTYVGRIPRAQRSRQSVIGVIADQSRSAMAAYLEAFLQGLAEGGYIEERNVTVESRWGDGRNDRLPALAADLVHRRIAVIVTMSTPAAHAAEAATAAFPIVFYTGSDPVAGGLVASLNRP